MSRHANPHAIPEQWGLADALTSQSGLNVVPRAGDEVVIAGELRFAATGPDGILIEDSFSTEMRIPRTYPSRGFPKVFETGDRIPQSYHHLADGSLCLGAPTRLRLSVLRSPSIGDFITLVVLPYLYGRSYFEKFGQMPFGELAHGDLGLARDLIAVLGMPRGTNVHLLLKAASMRRRLANKQPCPCDSGRRLGKCHNGRINVARAQLGRRWFAGQAQLLRS